MIIEKKQKTVIHYVGGKAEEGHNCRWKLSWVFIFHYPEIKAVKVMLVRNF